MHVQELMAKIDAGQAPPLVLLCPGKAGFNKEPFEPFLAEQALTKITDQFVDPNLGDLIYSALYADETEPGAIVSEAQTLPFLAERRVIVVRKAERYMAMAGGPRSAVAPLLAYCKAPSDTTILVLVSEKADKRKALYKAFVDAGGIAECPQLSDNEVSQWARSEVSKLGKQIDRNAIGELLRRAGSRMSDIKNAIGLVTAYIGESKNIGETDVVAACADVAEETVWALTDAIAASDTEHALRVLHQLFGLGKSPDEIIGTINWLLENAYRAAPESALQPKSRFVAEKVMPLVRRLGFNKIKAACALCTDTHFMMRCTGVDRELALEMLVLKLAYRPKRPARAS
jgi:DNA polymerase III subunit delta